MSILDFLDTGEYRIVPDDFTHPTFQAPTVDGREVVTRQLTPPATAARPYVMSRAVPGTTERTAFALAGDSSGEVPILGIDPAATARLALPVTYGTPAAPEEPDRPWFYRGQYRATRSRMLLVAATWPGGLR